MSSGQDPDAASQERHRDGDTRGAPFVRSPGLAELLPDRRAYTPDDVALLELPSRAARARSREGGPRDFGDGASLVRRYASCRGRYGSLPKINCLQRWYRPEFIAIGDMSPMFGVGVNHGVQDAVQQCDDVVDGLVQKVRDPLWLHQAWRRPERARDAGCV